LNLFLLVANGVGLSFWLIYYTDLFPVVGGLLGLGGAFAWIAFLANVISDERKEMLQQAVERIVLESRVATGVMVLIPLLHLFGFAAWHGTLVIDSLGDAARRVASVHPAGQDAAEDLDRQGVDAGSGLKLLVPTGLFASQRYTVKLSGLPPIDVYATAMTRRHIVAPDEFWSAPVVLIRAEPKVAATAANGHFSLKILLDGKQVVDLPYDGQAIWIGTDADTAVPQMRLDRWRLSLAADQSQEVTLLRWATPEALTGIGPLANGNKLEVQVIRPNAGGVFVEGRIAVQGARSEADFPQEVVLRDPAS